MFTVYLKPTNNCNVGCLHCYLPESTRASKFKMSLDTVKRVGEFLAEGQQKQNEDKVFILWHGGEPLVLSPEFYWKAGEILDNILPNHQEGIQTSLIPYTSKYKDLFLQRFGGEIGTSMDFGTRQIKGSSESYQKLWLDKIQMLREDGMSVGVLMTPTKTDVMFAKDRIDWFHKNKLGFISFERYNQFGMTLPDRPSNLEHSKFLIKVFDHLMTLIDTTGEAPYIKVISAAINGILFDYPGDRWGGSCQSDFIVIEPDGSLNNCPDKAMFEAPYGNIENHFKDFMHSPMRKKWIKLQEYGHCIHDCYNCENNTWCKSGCPITPNATPHSDETECSGYKTFINHIRRYIEKNGKEKLLKYANYGFLPSYSIDEWQKLEGDTTKIFKSLAA